MLSVVIEVVKEIKACEFNVSSFIFIGSFEGVCDCLWMVNQIISEREK